MKQRKRNKKRRINNLSISKKDVQGKDKCNIAQTVSNKGIINESARNSDIISWHPSLLRRRRKRKKDIPERKLQKGKGRNETRTINIILKVKVKNNQVELPIWEKGGKRKRGLL